MNKYDEQEKILREAVLKADLFTWQKAREDYINFMMPMIKKMALSFMKKGNGALEFDDYVNEAYLRVSEKIDTFKFGKGVKLATFMYWQIQDAMQCLKASMEQAYRCPTTNVKLNKKIKQYIEENPDVDYDELAEKFGTSKKRVAATIEISNQKVSIYQQKVGDEKTILLDTLKSIEETPEEKCILKSAADNLEKVLSEVLNEFEYFVINEVFGLKTRNPKTLVEVAKTKKMSNERIRQIKEDALNKIRNSSKSKEITDLLFTITKINEKYESQIG